MDTEGQEERKNGDLAAGQKEDGGFGFASNADDLKEGDVLDDLDLGTELPLPPPSPGSSTLLLQAAEDDSTAEKSEATEPASYSSVQSSSRSWWKTILCIGGVILAVAALVIFRPSRGRSSDPAKETETVAEIVEDEAKDDSASTEEEPEQDQGSHDFTESIFSEIHDILGDPERQKQLDPRLREGESSES